MTRQRVQLETVDSFDATILEAPPPNRAKEAFAKVSAFCNTIHESRLFQQLTFAVIILASVLVGVETDPTMAANTVVNDLDNAITYWFLFEVVLKIIGAGFSNRYLFINGNWRDPNYWNVFDFVIVVLCFLQINAVAVIRLFRLLRVLKLVKAVPTLKMLLSGLIASMGSIGYILVLLLLLFYAFSVVGMILFQDKDSDHFGTLPITFVTLFAISTGGSWTEVMYGVVFDCDDGAPYPECTTQTGIGWLGVIYFTFFILLSSMVLLNLVIGVITQSMESARKDNMATAEGLYDTDVPTVPPTGIAKKINDVLVKLRLRAPEKAENRELRMFLRGQQGMLRALDAHIELVTRLRITVVNLQKRRETLKKRAIMASLRTGYCPLRDGIRQANPDGPGMMYQYELFINFFARVARSFVFTTVTLLVVLLAAILVGLQTDDALDNDPTVAALEELVKWLFVVDALVKIIACGSRPYMYLFEEMHPVFILDYWNLLDLIVIAASFLSIKEVAILRLFRLIRILKLIRAIPTLRNLLAGLVKSLGSMLYVFLLLLLLFYIFGILGILVFKDNDPVHFSSLGLAFLTLLQCATGDDWTDVLYINMRGCTAWIPEGYPADRCEPDQQQSVLAVVFFVIFMLLAAMVTLNLVIGVINSSMEETQEELRSEKELAMMNLLDHETNGGSTSTASHTQVTTIMSSLLKLQDNQLQALLDKHLLGRKSSDALNNAALAQPINFVDPLMFRPPPREKKAGMGGSNMTSPSPAMANGRSFSRVVTPSAPTPNTNNKKLIFPNGASKGNSPSSPRGNGNGKAEAGAGAAEGGSPNGDDMHDGVGPVKPEEVSLLDIGGLSPPQPTMNGNGNGHHAQANGDSSPVLPGSPKAAPPADLPGGLAAAGYETANLEMSIQPTSMVGEATASKVGIQNEAEEDGGLFGGMTNRLATIWHPLGSMFGSRSNETQDAAGATALPPAETPMPSAPTPTPTPAIK